ncbi:BLUF domain-containing protein [Psychrobacter sp. FDAARGOS_221]|uniref:BLUF domain-containing protein n=1 Tax=Psychrobacter sp. FDAARGOS_221 TaxID=1975705 RepID=UPI000BB55B46|nr:BLUF domain-containing protein [Psychrobacter sp. FDAARGOS_221]PNK60199.1 blue light sensor protein [Psychrobacter sp. FDAARGOS_221]
MPLYEQETANRLKQIEDDALIRMVYVSSLSLKNRFQPKVFKTIQSDARDYNKQHGITGTLCYGNGCFLQCLEGEKRILLPVLQNLFDDERHKNIKILLIKPIKLRQFINWGVRMLFLERWLWSPETKKQASSLAEFLPFRPYEWSIAYTEQFLIAIQKLSTPAHVKTSGIHLNAMGHLMRHIMGPHQAFIFIQGVLSIFTIIAIYILYKMFFHS